MPMVLLGLAICTSIMAAATDNASIPEGDVKPETVSLCQALNTASRKTHKLSNDILHARLIVLFTNRQLYGRALSCFWPVFQTLEQLVTENIDKHQGDRARVWGAIIKILECRRRLPGLQR
jgi:hypothetical protein